MHSSGIETEVASSSIMAFLCCVQSNIPGPKRDVSSPGSGAGLATGFLDESPPSPSRSNAEAWEEREEAGQQNRQGLSGVEVGKRTCRENLQELTEEDFDPCAEEWPSDDEFSICVDEVPEGLKVQAGGDVMLTGVQDPGAGAEAKSFLPAGVEPAACPVRPFFFFENVAKTAPSLAESEINWRVMSRDLYGIDPETIDSATVSASHRRRSYVSNLPKGSNRIVHRSKLLSIQDLFRGLTRYWPDWDVRRTTGKLHTICTEFVDNSKLRRFNQEVRVAVTAGEMVGTETKRMVRTNRFCLRLLLLLELFVWESKSSALHLANLTFRWKLEVKT